MVIIFAKQFRSIVDDFDTATQNAFGVLKKNSGDGDKDPDPDGKKLKEELKELDKKEDDLLAGLDQITTRVTKSLKLYDVERKELEAEVKDLAKDKNTTPPDAEDFEDSFEASKKALEKFVLRVRAMVMGRKDLGDKISARGDRIVFRFEAASNQSAEGRGKVTQQSRRGRRG